MERNQPYYSLARIKKLIEEGKHFITRQTYVGARAFNIFTDEEILNVILKIQMKDFYKSMASQKMPGTWQDVYCPFIEEKRAYIKLQILKKQEAVVIQFKEK